MAGSGCDGKANRGERWPLWLAGAPFDQLEQMSSTRDRSCLRVPPSPSPLRPQPTVCSHTPSAGTPPFVV